MTRSKPLTASANAFRHRLAGAVRSRTYDRRHRGLEQVIATKREAHELLLIEEADAWFEYLATTQAHSGSRYGEVEPWAWARLRQRLRIIRRRRSELRSAAA